MQIPMSELFLSKVAFAILKGLEYMNSMEILHSNIQPSSILVNSNGEIKICGFSCSEIMEDSICSKLTGDFYYMSVWQKFIIHN